MKNRFVPVVTALAMGMAMAFPVAAQVGQAAVAPSAVTGSSIEASVAEKINQVKVTLTALKDQVTATTTALDALRKAANDGAPLQGPYADFAAKYNALDNGMNTLREQSVAARASTEAYFQSRQQAIDTIQNKDIKESAIDRLNTDKSRYSKVLAAADQAKQKLQPFMSELKDVNTLLSVEMTAASVKSLSDTTSRLGRDAVGTVADAIAEVEYAMSGGSGGGGGKKSWPTE
jgi:DNA repair ATPase RecN